MARIAVAFLILPGKQDAVKQFARGALGPRRAELAESYRRFGITRQEWYLQQMPQGALQIAYIEAENPARMFREWAASRVPFDRWYKEQAGAASGIDFNQPGGPLPEQIFDWPGA